jgi:hypothetical protein
MAASLLPTHRAISRESRLSKRQHYASDYRSSKPQGKQQPVDRSDAAYKNLDEANGQ